MTSDTVDSLSDYHNKLRTLNADGSWIYRGQSEADWKLVPSVFRGIGELVPPYEDTDAEWIAMLERDIYRTFDQEYVKCMPAKNHWDRLALAQHYGTPTRLLDWTRSASIAAYFATAKPKGKQAAVWCLNLSRYPFPDFLGRITKTYGHRKAVLGSIAAQRQPSFFQEISKTLVPRPPGKRAKSLLSDSALLDREEGFLVVLDPPKFDDRIEAQKGLFTFHYSFDDYDLVWDLTRHLQDVEADIKETLLHKFVIPQGVRDTFRGELEKSDNLNWHQLFPDIAGLGDWLVMEREAQFKGNAALRK